MRKIFISAIITIFFCLQSITQTYPFPRNTDYPYGYKAATTSSEEAEATYNNIITKLLDTCNGNYRIVMSNKEQTFVEAMGFVMLVAAYYGDKDVFDGLYGFYQSKRTKNANNMMAWKVTCDSILDPGSASDGDVDVAFSLIVAHEQWGGDYLDKAIDIINVLKNSVLIDCNGISALAPGYSLRAVDNGLWGGCELLDIMYHTPAFFRVFADVTNDTIWDKLADDTYIMLNASAHPSTGLVPDWQSASGTPGGNNTGRCDYYKYDACRVPWRIALDYLWNGNSKAEKWCNKISNWANEVGAENIIDGYHLDGTPHETAQYHNNPFVGSFAVASMCNSQQIVDTFGNEMESDDFKTDFFWFSLCTRGLYMFTLTGNFWKPEF